MHELHPSSKASIYDTGMCLFLLSSIISDGQHNIIIRAPDKKSHDPTVLGQFQLRGNVTVHAMQAVAASKQIEGPRRP
jgi:hypothetical protein